MIKFKRTLLIVLVFAFTLFAFMYVKVEALDDLVTIQDVNGNDITYRDTSKKVMIPRSYKMPNADFRAAWISAFTGDVKGYVDQYQYKAEMMRVFDVLEYYNMNAMIFHIRIHNDALYESKYNDWSGYYSLNPDWDALPWIIEEAHKRGIEFHAWLNPYRVTNSLTGSLEDLAKKYKSANAASNPNNLLKAGAKVILNPGERQVKTFLRNTIQEIITKYDVDAIHFDDYFYIDGVDDSDTYKKNNPQGLNLADWRRSQVDELIQDLDILLEQHNKMNNKSVQLGISPSGVWKNGYGEVTYDPVTGNAITSGSHTGGFAHYGSYLYSDTKKWIDNEWIDYIIPQTYQALDNRSSSFADMIDWWAAIVKYKKVNLYAGIGLYMVNESGNTEWQNNKAVEAERQLRYLTKHPEFQGSSIFDYKHVAAGKAGSAAFSKIKTDVWYKPTLLPEIKTQSHLPIANVGEVSNLSVSKTSVGFRLDWNKVDNGSKYAIYRSTKELTYDISELVDVVGDADVDGRISFIDTSVSQGSYIYGVKAISRTNKLGSPVTVSTKNAPSGTLIELEKVKNIEVSENRYLNEMVEVKWNPIYTHMGSEIEYEVYSSVDNINWKKELTTIITTSQYYIQRLYLNSETTYIKIKLKNNIGTSESEVFEIKVSEKYPDVRNFYYTGSPYVGETITFQWTKIPNANHLKYIVQYSLNQNDWIDITTVANPVVTEGIFYKQKFVVPSSTRIHYFRVVASDAIGVSYSPYTELDFKVRLPQIPELKMNEDEIKPITEWIGEDEIMLTWNPIVISGSETIYYRIEGSENKKHWNNISSYIDYTTGPKLVDGKYVFTGNIGSFRYKFYIRIVAYTLSGISYSDTYEFIVETWSHDFEEMLAMMRREEDILLNEMNIFS